MVNKDLLYSFGSKRYINFYDKKNNNSYLREIVYPKELSEIELSNYVKNSLSNRVNQLTFKTPEDCLIFCEKEELHVESPVGLIDKSWITGEIIVVDYFTNNQKNYLEIAIDMNLEKSTVFSKVRDLLYSKFKSERILFYESTNDCWIKRT